MLSVKRWRVRFVVQGRAVTVEEVRAGHRPRELASDPALDLPRRFVARFP